MILMYYFHKTQMKCIHVTYIPIYVYIYLHVMNNTTATFYSHLAFKTVKRLYTWNTVHIMYDDRLLIQFFQFF